MKELIDLVSTWRGLGAFGMALLVFGFAPGFFLRLIVRLYPKGHPRRDELVAELYAMPRLWRPMWVAQQLECGLFEGLEQRRFARRRRRRIEEWDEAVRETLLAKWRAIYDNTRVIERVVTFSDEKGEVRVESRDHFPRSRRRVRRRSARGGDVGPSEP